MKGLKLWAIWLTAALTAVCLFGCSAGETADTEGGDKYVVWQGAFSEEKLKAAIDGYERRCVPVPVTGTGVSLTLPVGQAEEYAVCRVSPVEEGYRELDAFIDQAVDCVFDGEKGELRIDADWWYLGEDWTRQQPFWSYLIRTFDGQTEKFWYFRVKYSQ